MSRRKKYMILILVTVVIVFLITRPREWSPPMQGWYVGFDSIEEIHEMRRLAVEGSKAELLAFIEGTNNGENLIEDRRSVDYLIDMLNDTVLPVDSSWVSLSYESVLENIFVRYDVQEGISLSFIFEARDGDETFDEVTERLSANNTRSDITEEIATFSNRDDFEEDTFRIGHGVEAFAFYNQFGDYSIEEWKDGWGVTLSLNVNGIFISTSVDGAPTKERAFEILANVEFARGGGWFDNVE